MNKVKLSNLLDQYSESLKKYGIYMLVVLFAFTFSLSFMLNKINKEPIGKTTVLPNAEVSIESTENKQKPEQENKQEPVAEKKEVSIEAAKQIPTQPKKEQLNSVVSKGTDINNDKKAKTSKTTENTKVTVKEPNQEKPLVTSNQSPVTFIWPIKGVILTEYGLGYSETYGDYRLHPGIDIKSNPGDSIAAAADGKVILVENSEGEKIVIELDHGNGWVTRYSQLAQSLVKVGQIIKSGDTIGKAGSPGSDELQAGSHLHFQIKQNQQWVNPLDYLKE